MPRQILLVDSVVQELATFERVLTRAGHCVTSVTSFETAALQASLSKPDILITAVRLGRFNGVHLALRFKVDYPGLPIIVLGEETEVSLAADAMQTGGRFVPKTTPPEQFLEFVAALLAGRTPRDLVSTRRWPRRDVQMPAKLADRTARVVDVSYGGLRLECDTAPAKADAPVDIEMPTVGMVLTDAVFRWSQPSKDAPRWSCGVELGSVSAPVKQAWRRVVDSVR